jgi:hypothetical protein
MQLLQNGKQQFIDQNGSPLVGGQVFFYAPGTTNPATTYQDAAGNTPNSNPIVLDSNGQATIWGTGTYRQVVQNAASVTIWDQLVQTSDAGFLAFQANLANASSIGYGDALVAVKQPLGNAVARTQHDHNADYVSVKDFGAKGDGATNDTAAFNNAFNAAKDVYIPPGTYNVSMVTIPGGCRVRGAGKGVTTLVCPATADHVLLISGSAHLSGLTVNGNQKANTGILINADYVQIEEVHAQYCANGFAAYRDVWSLTNTSTDNNTNGFYSGNRGINARMFGHTSNGGDTYGIRFNYTDQQPQGVQMIGCLLFGNQFGLFFDKDAFSMEFGSSIIDGCTDTAIMFLTDVPLGTSTDFYFHHCFLSCTPTANNVILISPGHTHLVFESNDISNGYSGIAATASATTRVENLTISNCQFGLNRGQDLSLDSVNGCVVESCCFTGGGGTTDIATVGTYTAGTNPPVQVRNCNFQNGHTQSAFLTNFTDCIGWKTKARGTSILPASTSTLVVAHGLNATPTNVICTPKGNVGSFWVVNITSTSFTFACSSAPGTNTEFSWEAKAD